MGARLAPLLLAVLLCVATLQTAFAAEEQKHHHKKAKKDKSEHKDDSPAASFAGKPLEKPAKTEAKVDGPVFPVRDIDDLSHLNDDQLYSIFTQGVADVPSALASEKGMYTMCVGRPLANGFTNGSWPNGVWPNGDKSPINNVIERFWRGKVFTTNPMTNQTNLWNLMWTNSTVAVVGNISVMEQGMSADKKPSAVINYANNEALIFRPLRDEMRRVGGTVWLGRGWVTNIVAGIKPSNPAPLAAPIINAVEPLGNYTWHAAVQASGLQGPASNPTMSGAHYETGEPFALFYFALDCTDNAVPKLYYTPVALTENVLTSATGYAKPLNTLPELNKAADSKAVENLNLEFPTSTVGVAAQQPFILYPWKPSDAGPTGFLRVPAQPFEPIFGAFWLYNQTNPANPTTTGLAAQVAELPPRIPAFNPNPVTYP